jgi:hypothetical protein
MAAVSAQITKTGGRTMSKKGGKSDKEKTKKPPMVNKGPKKK